MSLCVVFARFKNSTPSTSQKHTISKSFKELQKWRHIVLSPSDADVNCCLSLLWPDPDFFLLILKRFFNFIVHNQHALGSITISMDLHGLHTLGGNNHTIHDTRMDVHEELENFVKALPAQSSKRVELHIDDHELASMAYCIEKPETLANEEYERVTIRIRDWCLQNRTLIKAMPQWIQYWEDKGRKYEWVDYDLVKNRATGKKRYITIPRRNATCDDGDQCSEWQ